MLHKLKQTILTEKNISYILNTLLAWLFSLSIMSGIISLTILDTTFADMASMTFHVVIISAIVLYNKYTIAAFTLFAAGFSFYAYRALIGDYPTPISDYLTEHMYNINLTWLFMTGEEGFTRALNDSALQLLAFAFSLCSTLLLRLKFSYPIIFALGAGVFLTANIAHPYGKHASLALVLITLILIYIKRAKNSTKRVIALAPIAVLTVMLATAIPMPNIDEGRRILAEAYEEVFWAVRSPFIPRYFSTHWLGFEQRDGTLGGNLSQSGDFIMWVFADEPIYLTGVTKSIFTGRSWESRHADGYFTERYYPDFSAMRNFELMAIQRAYGNYDPFWDWVSEGLTQPDNINDITHIFHDELRYRTQPRRVDINIGRVRTGTIFRPPGSLALSLHGDDYGLLQRGPDLRTTPTFARNASYSLMFHTVDIENYYIQAILAESRRGFYEERLREIETYIYNYPHVFFEYTITRYIYENIRIPYANYVFENYTALPDTTPDRVRALAYSITEDYSNDFDRAMAIKHYLREMPYSLTPGDLPYGRDFVDHFLFDVRRGYCTHFASAMAVMARIVGIPSRYNIGFATPAEQYAPGVFKVYGIHAHAWTELYFEGVGWVIFEATPPYEPAYHYYAYTPSIIDHYVWDDEWFMYEDYEMQWLLHMMDAQLTAGASYPAQVIAEADSQIILNPLSIIATGAALALGTYIFIRKAEENKRHRIINSDRYRDSILEGFKGLAELLAFYGLPMQSHESAISYARRLEKLSPLGAMQLRTAAEIFSRARYSQIDMNKDDADFIKKNYFHMYGKMKESGQRVRFFVHRYIKKM